MKKCFKCFKLKKSFYRHLAFKGGFDLWCRDCVRDFVKSKQSLISYCKINFRVFSEELFSSCVKNNTGQDVFKAYFARFNYKSFYKCSYFEPEPDCEKIYSTEFYGFYTPFEIEYLQNYYASLISDYDINTLNHHDYAKKVAKSSLMADKAFEGFASGLISEKQYKEAQAIFDSLSQSAKFSEKSRNHSTNSSLSFGEFVKKFENEDFSLRVPFSFPKDDYDRLIEEFKFTLSSIKK